jgi:hypothetical protein
MPGPAARELGLLVTLVLNRAVSKVDSIVGGSEMDPVLGGEYHTSFIGYRPADIDLVVPVDRRRQYEAVGHHPSQALPTSMPW